MRNPNNKKKIKMFLIDCKRSHQASVYRQSSLSLDLSGRWKPVQVYIFLIIIICKLI